MAGNHLNGSAPYEGEDPQSILTWSLCHCESTNVASRCGSQCGWVSVALRSFFMRAHVACEVEWSCKSNQCCSLTFLSEFRSVCGPLVMLPVEGASTLNFSCCLGFVRDHYRVFCRIRFLHISASFDELRMGQARSRRFWVWRVAPSRFSSKQFCMVLVP